MPIIKCDYCKNDFERSTGQINRNKKRNLNSFCSQKCSSKNKTKKGVVLTTCSNCNKNVIRLLNQAKRGENSFCNSSCAAIYNNARKTKGARRSKLEAYLENKLIETFPDIDFHFNRSDTINSELDIYIPSLKLAFELNGIFHYEPIFGEKKLSQIQNNDNRKYQACLEKGIELCTIDSSGQKYFKESTSIKYLDIIKLIINKKYRYPT